MYSDALNSIDSSWHSAILNALNHMSPSYLAHLAQDSKWLPGSKQIFNSFSLPVEKVNYVLLGESPYPRPESANGYAFWDALVTNLWSNTGLSKPVNRATSLRNMIKMLLCAEGLLDQHHLTQPDIANLNKDNLIKTNGELFGNFIQHGFLLLNASLVLQKSLPVKLDAQEWKPFMQSILAFLIHHRPQVCFILLGKIANAINPLLTPYRVEKVYAEHPYNLSFIHNKAVQDFFRPFKLISI